jgi:lipopolysaccharide export LptBFGC system permease protein LptF
MKKILVSFCAFMLVLVMLAGCNKNSPKEAATTWLTCFWHMDYEGAKKVSTQDTKNFLSQLQQFSTVISESSKKDIMKTTVSIKDVQENGDKAVVKYETSDMPGKEQTINLVKVSDKWLVQFTKNDDTAAKANDQPTGVDSTGPISSPTDTGTIDTSKH